MTDRFDSEENYDPTYSSHGRTDGRGAVDMGDGFFAMTTDYETVRLPDELGGLWVMALDSQFISYNGVLAQHLTLAHSRIDCLILHEGPPQQLWIRKPTTGGEEE